MTHKINQSPYITFNHHKIRCVLHNDTWWLMITDVIAALTDSSSPSNYLKDLKRRNPAFLKGWGQIAALLPIQTVGGTQKMSCTNVGGVFQLMHVLPYEKCAAFKGLLMTDVRFLDITPITQIKIKYHFDPTFDLRQELIHLPSTLATYPKFLRLSKKHREILDLCAALKRMRTTLKKTAVETKITLDLIPDTLVGRGIPDIRDAHKEWNIGRVDSYLSILNQACLWALESIPKDMGGRQVTSKPLHIIFRLVDIYVRGTKRIARCGWSDVDSTHVGKFYDFIIDIQPLLKSAK